MTEIQKQAKELDELLTEVVLNPHISIGFARRDAIGRAAAILRRIEHGELVEVVRCGECEGYIKKNRNGKPSCDICRMFGFGPNGYCHNGRRKDNAN